MICEVSQLDKAVPTSQLSFLRLISAEWQILHAFYRPAIS